MAKPEEAHEMNRVPIERGFMPDLKELLEKFRQRRSRCHVIRLKILMISDALDVKGSFQSRNPPEDQKAEREKIVRLRPGYGHENGVIFASSSKKVLGLECQEAVSVIGSERMAVGR